MKNQIPLFLTLIRAFLGPVLLILGFFYPEPVWMSLCLIIAFLSDVFDGIIARRLGIATPMLRRMDSIADSIFYVSAVGVAWHLYPNALLDQWLPFLVLIILELIRYIFDFIKFKKEASYHMWSSKAWGIALFVGFIALLGFGHTGILFALAIYVGILADLEGLIISVILKEWKTDVPSFIHALKMK